MKNINLANLTTQAFQEVESLISRQERYSHPFRNRFEHTKRVLRWAKRIQHVEGGDIEIITFAVLFHDTGWSENVDHALIGAEHSEKFLIKQDIPQSFINRVASAVRTHNKRQYQREDLPVENRIVMDADLLDEVGVTALVWDSMATAIEDDPSYKRALEQNQVFFEREKNNINILQTKTGKNLFSERIAIWEKCLDHFRYELGERDEIPPTPEII